MTSAGEHDMTSPTQKRHDEHHDPLAKVIWDAASRESSMDLPSWESLNGDRRVAHDVARAVREYLRDVEGLVSAVTDQSGSDEEIVKTAPTTSPAQRRHDEMIAMLRELGNLLDDRLPEPPTYTIETRTCRTCRKAADVESAREPVDVTEEPPVHIVCGVCGERSDSLLGHVDCAPGVDPDEALASSIEYRLETTHSWLEAARAAREHIEAEGEHAAMALVRRAEDERDALRERLDALRADVGDLREAWKMIPDILSHAVPHLALDQVLAHDDERAAKREQR